MAKPRAHVLVFPLPQVGHFHPIIHLLYLLDTHRPGIIVTVVGTLNVASDLAAIRARGDLSRIDLRIHDESSWRLPRYEKDPIFPYRASLSSESYWRQIQGLREQLVARKNEPDAVTAIVADCFFEWCEDLAEDLGIPWYSYFSVSGTGSLLIVASNHFLVELANRQHRGQQLPGKAERVSEAVPGFENFSGAYDLRYGDMPAELFEFPEYATRVDKKTTRSARFLINTTEEIEEKNGGVLALQKLVNPSKIYTIGPCVQLRGFGPTFNPQDPAVRCLSWLDKQKEGSVLYVSFGSIVVTERLDLSELAAGLEKSQVPFLWALKVESGEISDVLPPGFQERTAGWGLIETQWVPQVKILEHSATGGFITHSGWNSVLETICTAVPCIAWPVYADQKWNSRFIEKTNIGILISSFKTKNQETFDNITRREAEMAIRSLMLEESGRKVKSNIAEMQKTVTAAVAKGGSSHRYLHKFLDEIEPKSIA